MGQLAKWRDDLSGVQPSNVVQTCGGTATAYTLTSNGSIQTLTNGWTLTFTVGSTLTNTGSVTLAVDSLSATVIQGVVGSNLVGGELVAGSTYTVTYQGPNAAWVLHDFYAGAGTSGVAASTLVQTGMMMDFAGATAPTGWLLCYGQAISRSSYSALYALVSTTYGSGDGSTTFNIPDFRGRASFGKDNMGGTAANNITSGISGVTGTTLGATGGAQGVTILQTNLPALNLTVSSITVPYGLDTNISGSGAQSVVATIGSGSSGTVTLSGATAATGGSGTELGSLPPALIVSKIIKT